MARRIVGISGNLARPSRTRVLVEQRAVALVEVCGGRNERAAVRTLVGTPVGEGERRTGCSPVGVGHGKWCGWTPSKRRTLVKCEAHGGRLA